MFGLRQNSWVHIRRLAVKFRGRLFSINTNMGPRLCPSLTLWPHSEYEFDTPGLGALFVVQQAAASLAFLKTKEIGAAGQKKNVWWHLHHLRQSFQQAAHGNSVGLLSLQRVQINLFNLSGLVDWDKTCLPPQSWQTLSLCAQQWVMQSEGDLWKTRSKLLTIKCGHTQH